MLYEFYTKTTINMMMTNEMLSARVETLEKQVASLLKDFKGSNNRVEALEKQLAELLKTEVPQEVVKPKSKSKKTKEETSEDELEVKKPKKEPKVKKSKDETTSDDEDKPKKKRGTNGYITFSKSVRDEVIAKLSVGDEKPKNTEIMKQQAAMWAELSVEEKAEWTAKANEINTSAE
jgi:nitrate/nitrite-specific signal transduction histidine kinase